MTDRIFIGVAWPYANGPLHLGHLAGGRGLGVLDNPWSQILGLAPGRTLEALRDAHTQGLLDLLVAGNVVDVSFPTFGGVA